MKRIERIKAMAEDIAEIPIGYPKLVPSAERQIELSAVAILENLWLSFSIEGGKGAKALSESKKALKCTPKK